MFRAGILVLMGLQLVAAGCSSTSFPPDSSARDAIDAPAAFEVLERGVLRSAHSGEGCRSPMFDPRDGTRLMLDRSAEGQGDYSVPEGRYGVGKDELMRIDCATGKPTGVVRR